MNTMIKIAKEIAAVAHRGKVDKAGQPYIQHLEAVAAKLKSADEQTVAWLHDVLADTDYTQKHLSVFFPASIVEAVEALTKHRGEEYDAYLKRVSDNPLATKVKLADLEHNSDLSRYESPSPKDRSRVQTYVERREMLLGLAQRKGIF
jgi:(p)ppGpp synthase/HD superfamily hydrolase